MERDLSTSVTFHGLNDKSLRLLLRGLLFFVLKRRVSISDTLFTLFLKNRVISEDIMMSTF